MSLGWGPEPGPQRGKEKGENRSVR